MGRRIDHKKIAVFAIFAINSIMIVRFKITFATVTIIGVFAVILLITFLYGEYRKNTEKKMIKYVGIILSVIFIMWCASFLYIEYKIISGIRYSIDREKYDYIVVLGTGLKGDKISFVLKQRLDKTVEILSEDKDTLIIVSGGKGPDEDISEACAMERYLIEKGIDQSRILLEEKSTSTFENFKFSKSLIIESEKINPKVLVITNDYHLYRAGIIAEKNGLKVKCVGSKTPIMIRVNYLIREYYGVMKSYIF